MNGQPWPMATMRRTSTGRWSVWVDLPNGGSLDFPVEGWAEELVEASTFPETYEIWRMARREEVRPRDA